MIRTSMLGTAWCVGTAIEHIERIEAHEQALRLFRAIHGDGAVGTADLPLTEGLKRSARRRALDGFLLALRDGYVRATGRRSSTRGFLPESSPEAWRLHATDATLITTDEWRAGDFAAHSGSLTGPSWQFIQIEVPDFMVKAIWPDHAPVDIAQPATDAHDPPYTTPYLDLMQAAISRFGLTTAYQSKKENLSDWFQDRRVEGMPISRNLANAMATLIRLPSAQRGGAKRVQGPDLRQTG
jgi:hypothetical protein